MRRSRKHRTLTEPVTEPEAAKKSTMKSTATAQFMVGRSADEVLSRTRIYFARRWPHAGDVSRKRASVEFLATTRTPYGRLFMELFKVVGLSLLTAGLYLLYWLLFQRSRLTNHYHAEVFARNQEDGTLVRVNAGTEEHRKRLEEWVLQELCGQPIEDDFRDYGARHPTRKLGSRTGAGEGEMNAGPDNLAVISSYFATQESKKHHPFE